MNVIHPTTGRKVVSIEDALVLLKKAREKYNEAHTGMESVRRAETNALSALNEAQRDFDSAVAAVRSDPPWNSDWHSKDKQGEAA